MKIKHSAFFCFTLALTFSTLTSCLRIPAEAIEINTIVTARILDAKQKHVNLVNEYFKLKIEAFDSWFLSTYEPAHKVNYAKVWNKENPNDSFDINNEEHRSRYVADSIAEYEELTDQIEVTKETLVTALDTAYTDMAAANEAIGRLLQSAKALTDAQRVAWNNTVGKLIPALNSDTIDKEISEIQELALGRLTQ